ncbi:MAG: hypothetical protein M1831_004897 [Alyxoria varia]|nr:MAG: hypothetical protein M1831_004897 [Alyxoria varia]
MILDHLTNNHEPLEKAQGDLLIDWYNITNELENEDRYSMPLYLARARVNTALGFPDLAVMDAYKVLLLNDEVLDGDAEYHEKAFASATSYIERQPIDDRMKKDSLHDPWVRSGRPVSRCDPLPSGMPPDHQEVAAWAKQSCAKAARHALAQNLLAIGCLQTAHDYLRIAITEDSRDAEALRLGQWLSKAARPYCHLEHDEWSPHLDRSKLPDKGLVRREIYHWNKHEQDRLLEGSLKSLNDQMAAVAPKLEISVTKLPKLSDQARSNATESQVDVESAVITQLGVFAVEDIEPGESILCERSMLTANARLHEPLCDACGAELPNLQAPTSVESHDDESFSTCNNEVAADGPNPCPDCDDTVFCSNRCLQLAHGSYHNVLCGTDVEPLVKDVPPHEAADALYTQLLFRAIAMSYAQDKHPLELDEVKSIWGDFTEPVAANLASNDRLRHVSPVERRDGGAFFSASPKTLPFNFRSQILQPLHYLELLGINIFEAPHQLAEVWVYNTLYAKMRGTASARISPRDGRPEVAAVHPLWCLANHSCDPSVEWEWAGEITFKAKTARAEWKRKTDEGEEVNPAENGRKGGIRKGEEVLNHYVDIDLPVQGRREWGVGALGGFCRCSRCLWESREV